MHRRTGGTGKSRLHDSQGTNNQVLQRIRARTALAIARGHEINRACLRKLHRSPLSSSLKKGSGRIRSRDFAPSKPTKHICSLAVTARVTNCCRSLRETALSQWSAFQAAVNRRWSEPDCYPRSKEASWLRPVRTGES